MHPAYSVILFTTSSGAGYGLLVLLGLGGPAGLLTPGRGLGIASFALALGLVSIGLLSSTFHLGRPERAWRAFSQWRTSWLSREGVLAVATYPAAVVAALGWIAPQSFGAFQAVAGVTAAVLALATLVSTGMIYASLRTIPRWSQPLTVPVYLALGLASGAVLLNALVHLAGSSDRFASAWLALGLTIVAWLAKEGWWRGLGMVPLGLDAGDATGLKALGLGHVRTLEPAHTQPNYVMREMGYRIARRHADRLRGYARAGLFVVPAALLLLVATRNLPDELLTLVSVLAVVAMAFGVLVERWLFFAEAEHVSMLYYGLERI
ncbi:MAG: DmsC/YnfH family molybdoenzyme membrane anchor subunit [Hyphomicrobiaceae bacterium]